MLYLHNADNPVALIWLPHPIGFRLLTACSPLLTRSIVGSDRIEPVPGVLLCDPMCGSGTFVIEGKVIKQS